MSVYAKENYMQISTQKTKVLFFNPKRRKIDFFLQTKLDGKTLEVVNEIRLVGTIISDDLSG